MGAGTGLRLRPGSLRLLGAWYACHGYYYSLWLNLLIARLAPVCRRAVSSGSSRAICAPRLAPRPAPMTFDPRPTATCRRTVRRYRRACATSMSQPSVVTPSCSTTARSTARTATATALPPGGISPLLRERSCARPAAASRAVLAAWTRARARARARYGPSVTGHDASIAAPSRSGWPAYGAAARPREASSPRRRAATNPNPNPNP